MNYFPSSTQIIKFAKYRGLRTISGIDMLVYQAVESLRLYSDYEFNNKDSIELISFINNYCIKKENELLR